MSGLSSFRQALNVPSAWCRGAKAKENNMSEKTTSEAREESVFGQSGVGAESLTFARQVAAEVVAEIEARWGEGLAKLSVVPLMRTTAEADGAIRAYRTREACNLTGLRLRQFERFCEVMKATPTAAPFRVAQSVIDELPGRGGYPSASSLQRYACQHRRHW